MADVFNSIGLRVAPALLALLISGAACDAPDTHEKNCAEDPSVCRVGFVCNEMSLVCEPGITLESVSPPIGPSTGGVGMALTGAAFAQGMKVTFDGEPATGVTVTSPTTLEARLPARPGVRGKVIVALSAPPAQAVSRSDLFAYYLGQFSLLSPTTLGTVMGPQTVAAGDFNGDGMPDLAIAGYTASSVGILTGNGNGTFTAHPAVAVGTNPIGVAIGDMNGDGHLDVIAADFGSGGISVALGRGDGTFAASKFTTTAMEATAVVVVNADGDGNLDLAVANAAAKNVTVLYGKGDGTFVTPPLTISGAGNVTGIAFGEFGSGSGADLVVAYDDVSVVDVFLRSGARSYNPTPLRSAIKLTPRWATVADFNRDGRSDIAVANYGSNSVSVLFGQNGGGVAAATELPIGTGPYTVYSGDVNGDGVPDIITANPLSNDIAVLLAKGDGSFEAAKRFASGNNTRHVIAADFDRDGRIDIAAVNYNSSTASIFLNSSQ